MQKRIMLFATIPWLCFGSCSQAPSGGASDQGLESSQGDDHFQPWLRDQYGELCEIRASLLPVSPTAKNAPTGMIQILAIDGVDFTKEASVPMSSWDSTARAQVEALAPNDTFRATGFETLVMRGSPPGLATYSDGRYRNRMVADTQFSVQHGFVVLSVH